MILRLYGSNSMQGLRARTTEIASVQQTGNVTVVCIQVREARVHENLRNSGIGVLHRETYGALSAAQEEKPERSECRGYCRRCWVHAISRGLEVSGQLEELAGGLRQTGFGMEGAWTWGSSWRLIVLGIERLVVAYCRACIVQLRVCAFILF